MKHKSKAIETKILGLVQSTETRSKEIMEKAEKLNYDPAVTTRYLNDLIASGKIRKIVKSHKNVWYQRTPEGGFFWQLMNVREKIAELIDKPEIQRIREEIEAKEVEKRIESGEDWENAVVAVWKHGYERAVGECIKDLTQILFRINDWPRTPIHESVLQRKFYICLSEKELPVSLGGYDSEKGVLYLQII